MEKELSQKELDTINAEFKKAWPKLIDSDIILYKSSSNREKFIKTVVERQGIDTAAAVKRLKEIEAKCAA